MNRIHPAQQTINLANLIPVIIVLSQNPAVQEAGRATVRDGMSLAKSVRGLVDVIRIALPLALAR